MSAVNLVLTGHLYPDSQTHCPLFLHMGELTLHEQHPSGSPLLCTPCPTYPLSLRILGEALTPPLDSNLNHAEQLTLWPANT